MHGTGATGGTTAPIRVFILDDHEPVRRGLTELVTAGGDLTVVGTAASAAEALREIDATDPQVALLDARLPDGSGVDVCREVRSRHPELPCVILTAGDDDEALLAALLAGAAGYLVKQVGGSSIVDGIRTVAAGQPLVEPALVRRLVERLRRTSAADESASPLHDQDQQLLELIADGRTNAQIATRLGLVEPAVQERVEVLVDRLSGRAPGGPAAAGPAPTPRRETRA